VGAFVLLNDFFIWFIVHYQFFRKVHFGCHMSLSAKQAADAVGITKQGIIKAIKEGKISAEKRQNGQWDIQPVELFRVYQPIKKVDSEPTNRNNTELTHKVDTSSPLKILELELKLESAYKEIEMLKTDKEDYKNRLDSESEERRKLTMILSDMREKPLQKPTEASKGFWASLLGKNN
jgi:hypothetical protein